MSKEIIFTIQHSDGRAGINDIFVNTVASVDMYKIAANKKKDGHEHRCLY